MSISRRSHIVAFVENLETRRLLSASVWTIKGGDRSDTIDISRDPADASQILVTINGRERSRPAVAFKTLKVTAGKGNDNVTIADDLGLNIVVSGGMGNDKLTGAAGNERLVGGDGKDTILGNGGDDDLEGGAGSDQLDGGDGEDDCTGGTGNDEIQGGYGDDDLSGGTGTDQVAGGYDTDSIDGGKGSDTLIYQKDIDTVRHADKRDHVVDDSAATFDAVPSDQALRSWWIDAAVNQYSYLFDQTAYTWGDGYYPYDGGGVYMMDKSGGINWENGAPPSIDSLTTGAAGSSANANSSADHSNTNTQVAGVDESDIVETDGHYIYALSQGNLVITDVSDAAHPTITKTLDIADTTSGMYLDGNRLTLVSSDYVFNDGTQPGNPTNDYARIAMIIRPGHTVTSLTTYDITDRTNPTVAKTVKLDGYITASRSVDGKVYLVLSSAMQAAMPQVITADDGTKVYESEASYRAHLEADPTLLTTPKFTVSIPGQADVSGELVVAPQVYSQLSDAAETVPDGSSLNIVAVVDTRSASSSVPTATVMGEGSDIAYATRDHLYLLSRDWYGDATHVLKFSITDAGVSMDASGVVNGTVLNNFSVDEFNGDLRLATTSNPWDFEPMILRADGDVSGDGENDVTWDSNPVGSSVNIFTLRQDGSKLSVVGSLTGLAPQEQVFATRFVGEEGYLVTFEQVDPLFTLDLHDPTAPTVAGKLTIPGFSRYLQPLSDNLLLGLGQSGDADGNLGPAELSLFDVSDPARPARISTYDFADDVSIDGLFWGFDNHALSYFSDTGTLAIPFGTWSDWSNEHDVRVLHVDQAGFTDLGTIKQTGGIERSVRIGNNLFSTGPVTIQGQSLATPATAIGSVQIGAPLEHNTTFEDDFGTDSSGPDGRHAIWFNGGDNNESDPTGGDGQNHEQTGDHQGDNGSNGHDGNNDGPNTK